MSENKVHIVIADPEYKPTAEQKEKADTFFESIVTEYTEYAEGFPKDD